MPDFFFVIILCSILIQNKYLDVIFFLICEANPSTVPQHKKKHIQVGRAV